MNKALKITRVVVSMVVFMLLGAGLTCSAWFIPGVDSFLCGIQLGPAILGFSFAVIAFWLLVTIVLGRIYCSTVCPMGTLMDISSRAAKLTAKGRRRTYRYELPDSKFRYFFLAIVAISVLAGFMFLPSVLDPYNLFCRICAGVFNPVLAFFKQELAEVGVQSNYVAMAVSSSVASSILATLLLCTTVAVSMIFGRSICNTMCPIGTILGVFSRYSVFQFDIDTDLCTHCRRCESVCKAHCIDMQDHVVDGSRCVVCFNCVSVCPNKAMHYTANRKRLSSPLMQRVGPGEQQAEPSLDSVNSISKNLKK